MDYLYALQCIRESAPQFINYIFLFISEFVLKASIVIALIIYWSFDKTAGASILIGYSSSYSVNQLTKNIFCINRPWVLDNRLHVDPLAKGTATGYSFPSGHTVTAASIFGGISVWKRDKKWIIAIMAALTLLTAFSRNWLGAHTLKDVVTAICIAAVVLSLNYIIRFWMYKKNGRDTIVCFAGIGLAILALVLACLKHYDTVLNVDGSVLVDPYAMLTDNFTACGMLCGSLLGWWLERRFVNFNAGGTVKQRIIRSLIGIVIFAILYFGLSPLLSFMGPHYSHLVKYFVIFLAVMYVYPLIVVQFQKKHETSKAEEDAVEEK